MRRVALLATLCALVPVLPASAQTYTLRQLGTTSDISARGGVSDATTFVRVPAGFDVSGGTVAIRFTHSPLIRADRSTVTLLANDQPLSSERLGPSNANGGVIRAQLPRIPAPDGGFTLTARFSMRLTRDPCEDPSNPALWAKVSAASTVSPELVPARRTLADAFDNLLPDETNAALPIALPANPSDAELSAAGLAAAAYARAAQERGRDAFVEAAVGAPTGRAIKVASTSAAPGAGILETTTTGEPQLSVSGDPTGIRRAAQALVSPRLGELAGARAQIRSTPPLAPAAARPWGESEASFAQLQIGPRVVTGPGVQTLTLPAQRPPQWTVPRSGFLDLALSVGAGLQSGSSVTASVAGHELGSRKLEPGSGRQVLHFEAKDGLLDTDLQGRAVRLLPITLRFDQQLHHTGCTPLDIDGARTTVLETSQLRLPDHGSTSDLDLSRFPAPLAVPDHGVTVVVPNSPSTADLSAGLQLSAAAARFADPAAPPPELVRAQAVKSKLDARDLILVGNADGQLGHVIRPPAPVRPGPGGGTLVLAKSPWSGDHSVLSVRGTDPAGLSLATRQLASTERLAELVGSAVVVRPRSTGEPVATGSPAGGPPVALAPIEDNSFWSDLPPWAIPAAVLLLALIVTGVVVARRRWRGRIRA